ncbi:MAG TPA: phosphate ABC transporter substrate-binding protein PstS [Chromatiaceae bacterium]|nr:phosphate ABC transporter substrate-binding protein PstS [Chromatiaceae bacterium]
MIGFIDTLLVEISATLAKPAWRSCKLGSLTHSIELRTRPRAIAGHATEIARVTSGAKSMRMNPMGQLLSLLTGALLAVQLFGFVAVAAGATPEVGLENGANSTNRAPIKLIGDGASFPAPLYLRWFRDYYKLHPTIRVDYQSTSSAGGIKDLIGGRVDFAGSDVRLDKQQQAQVPGGVRQVPMTAGAIVLVYHLDGIADLNLSRASVIGILTGRIQRWNDAPIVADNPDVALPDDPITLVVRGDGSGTTFHLTQHLSQASSEFAQTIGVTMSPNWPNSLKQRGALIRGKGNDGVAAFVRAIPGSIGYVQYAYGYLTGMSMAALQNRAGNLVAPGRASFEAALDAITTDPNAIADPDGDGSYPIIAVSWLLFRNQADDPAKRQALLDVIDYALGPGQQVSEQLGYIRFSNLVSDRVRNLVKE